MVLSRKGDHQGRRVFTSLVIKEAYIIPCNILNSFQESSLQMGYPVHHRVMLCSMVWSREMSNNAVGSCYCLKVHRMEPMMAIVLLSLILHRSCDRANCSVNKSYDVKKRRSCPGNSTSKLLKLRWR